MEANGFEAESKEYFSESTIDKPPNEPDQAEMFPKPTAEEIAREQADGAATEREFEIELVLKIKHGKTFTIPLIAGEFPGGRVQELLELALKGRRNKQVIAAVLDLPAS